MGWAAVRATYWRRQTYAACGWTRVLLAYLLLPALWFHDPFWIAVTVLLLALSPFAFPPGKKVDNFMSKAVLGSLVWLRTAPRGVVAASWAAGFLLAALLVWALWTRRLVLSVSLAAALTLAKFGFLAWAAGLAARRPDEGERAVAFLVHPEGGA